MFYFKEIFFRVFYLILCLFFSFILLYCLQEHLFALFFLKITTFAFETSFVLSSPSELVEINFFFPLSISFIFLYPLVLWNFYFFIKTSLTANENINIKVALYVYIIYYFIFNIFLCLSILPLFWCFFEYFKYEVLKISTINIEYEPNLLSYTYNLFALLKWANICFFFVFFSNEISKYFSLTWYLKIKKTFRVLFVFLIFFIFSIFINYVYFLFFFVFAFIGLLLIKEYFLRNIIFFTLLKKFLPFYEIKKNCCLYKCSKAPSKY
jgi:hypothetical protein